MAFPEKIRSLTACCGLLLFASVAALAQSGQPTQNSTIRELEGTVTDAANAPADKAVVQLKDTKSLQIQSFITDGSGHYHFAGLSTDIEYQVKADHDGATSGWKTLSLFNTKKVATINLKVRK